MRRQAREPDNKLWTAQEIKDEKKGERQESL